MRLHLAEVVAAAGLVLSCGRAAREPVTTRAELVTIAASGIGAASTQDLSIWDLYGEPIASGQRYAVVDDRGYVGTLHAVSAMPCILACEGCCSKPQWSTRWDDPPVRDRTEGLVLAVGPVDGQYASLRRELPASVDPDGNPWAWSFVNTEEPRTLARFSFGAERSLLEARGRRVTGARIVELRLQNRGAWRVLSRVVTSDRQVWD